MQRYQLATPRLAIGTAAIALAASTLGVLVIMPATMDVDARVIAAQAVAASSDSTRDADGGLIAEHEFATAPCAVQASDPRSAQERRAASL